MNEESNHLISLISVVDDDPSMREAAMSLLKANGFRTGAFSSAEEFLDSPLVHETQCLILDLQMPGMGGLELQRHLAAKHPRIPVVFISAHGNEAIRKEAMRAGAVDFLSKPFSEDALLQAIHCALDRTK